MGKELEVKILNIDKKEIQNKLKEIGAELIKDEYQKNIVIDGKDDFIENTLNGYLRIRSKTNRLNNESKSIVTLKQILSEDKYRENKEIETEIKDSQSMLDIFKILGLDIKYIGYKERISYKYDNILFEIDTWDENTYPEPYMEIEVVTDQDLDRALELLDIDKDSITTKSISELRREKGL